MTGLMEQITSKKLGAALAAMLIISQTQNWRTQLLIAGIAGLHVVCQTILDWKYGRIKNGNGNGGSTT